MLSLSVWFCSVSSEQIEWHFYTEYWSIVHPKPFRRSVMIWIFNRFKNLYPSFSIKLKMLSEVMSACQSLNKIKDLLHGFQEYSTMVVDKEKLEIINDISFLSYLTRRQGSMVYSAYDR